MKATDLRIGDYFFYGSFGHMVQLGAQDILNIATNMHDAEMYSPIPLTEEILLKCGARRIDKYTFVLKGLFIHLRKIGFVFNVGKKKIIIEHLHALQNLTFSLTGEELKYTP